MNLRGPVEKLHKSGLGFYTKLAERFSENALIRESWSAMARDLDEQTQSLRLLRPSFWKLLKKEEKTLLVAIAEIDVLPSSKTLDPQSWSLHTSFTRTLDFEEQVVKVYAPLVYRLRAQSGRPLDFYVLVNAHLTRLSRLIQSFSGDPMLAQRSSDLVRRFEKEAQGPEPVPVMKRKVRRGTRVRAARRPALLRRSSRPAAVRKARPRLRTAIKRTAKPAKRLVKNVKLSPRRRLRR